MTIRSLQALAVVFCAVAPVTAHAEGTAQVMIENDRLEPWTLETLTGQRVNFVNRTGYPVHLQFIGDVRQHEVIGVGAVCLQRAGAVLGPVAKNVLGLQHHPVQLADVRLVVHDEEPVHAGEALRFPGKAGRQAGAAPVRGE